MYVRVSSNNRAGFMLYVICCCYSLPAAGTVLDDAGFEP